MVRVLFRFLTRFYVNVARGNVNPTWRAKNERMRTMGSRLMSHWNTPKLFRLLGYSNLKFLSHCKDGFKKKSTLLVSPSPPPSVAGVAVVETPEVGDVS